MNHILDYLEATARRMGKKPLVTDEYGSCSWLTIQSHAMSIGSFLYQRDVQQKPVPVLMDKTIYAIAAFMGAAYAGGFYVPMNPDLPKSRLEQILKVLQQNFVITDKQHLKLAASLVGKENVLLVEDLALEPLNLNALYDIRKAAVDTDPLYAIFTSGSTGTPKGVLVSHRSVLDFIDHFTAIFEITEKDTIANQAPFDFDVSVKDIYSAMKTGARLVIVPRRLFSRPAELLDFVTEHQATTLIWAVSALCLVSTFHGLDYKVPTSVRKVLFSGEVMPQKHLNQWMSHLPEAEFVNLYGPTEITCNCTYHIIDRKRDYSNGIPIGQAFPNERVFLLDENDGQVTETGKEGEICVAGSALSLGYYNAPEQTAERFMQNPLVMTHFERIYRTGDLAHYNDNNELVFSGRKDFQIKYMGHRIELEEIERAIAAVPGVERVCCLFNEEKQRLCGYYVGSIDKKALHGELGKTLPVFMIPTTLCQMAEMPMTKNGKIDRKALAETKRRWKK